LANPMANRRDMPYLPIFSMAIAGF
jgi:hypothetical protein